MTQISALILSHPGHGVSDATGPAHYLADPLHLLGLGLLVLALVAVARRARIRRR